MATSYIFDWHRQHNGGLWLDGGHGSEAARKTQGHPWIDTPLFDGSESEGEDEDESTKGLPDLDWVVSWRRGVLEACKDKVLEESVNVENGWG